MKTKVLIYNDQKVISIDNEIKKIIRTACRETLKYEGMQDDFQIEVTLVDNNKIAQINKEQRDIESDTDVLSFPLCENNVYEKDVSNGYVLLGDIVISAQKAIYQADLYGHSVLREFAFLTVHSMLHLLGYDHVTNKTDERIMFAKQEEVLNIMGLSVK